MNNSNNISILLTVIIFSYNHKDSISQAIDSILEQETTYSYEIWLCDDCSTDGTTKICSEYAKRHPDKIKLFAQPVNTYSDKITHVEIALKKVETKYLSILDGDDVWCDTNKVQIALEFLENNPEYVTFAHDTVFNDIEHGNKKSLVHEIHDAEIHNPVTFENILYLHTSSRIHRNVAELPKGRDFYTDLFLFYIFLDKGPLYYHDKIMSIYNITGAGAWSSVSTAGINKANAILQYKINKFFNYKYDVHFTSRALEANTLQLLKKICGIKAGWEYWYNLIHEETEQNKNQLKIISELQKIQHEVSVLYLTLPKMSPASEELTIKKIEENIRALYEYYLLKELPNMIRSYENASKINAHLVAAGLYFRYGRYRNAFLHLYQVRKMNLLSLFSIQSFKIIGKGLIFHLKQNKAWLFLLTATMLVCFNLWIW